MTHISKFLLCIVVFSLFFMSCNRDDDKNVVVVYIALDMDLSKPIIADFERKTGIKVLAKYDDEMSKTTGLVNSILSMKNNQKADVFWNNEIVQTIRLKLAGLTDSCTPENAKDIPAEFKDTDGHWFGFAARSRVILLNKKRFAEKFPDAEYPSCFTDLFDEKWGKEAAYAKPLFGTTATHFAAIFTKLGEKKAVEKFKELKNSKIAIKTSNGQTMQEVRNGQICWSWTDTDDAEKALAEKGNELEMIYASAWVKDSGALVLPNAISLLKNAPHKDAAVKFINFILSKEVEKMLADAAGKQIPLKPGIKVEGFGNLNDIKEKAKIFDISFENVGKQWDNSRKYLEAIFN
ncbi:MAG: extracellular solute-binding protein [Planctomycetes bacterium]|nr:extracellular solute-binding protein [Planctomycetota bacterium]